MEAIERNDKGAIFITADNTSAMFQFYYLKRREYKDGTCEWHLCVDLRSQFELSGSHPRDQYMILDKIRGTEEDAMKALEALMKRGNAVKKARVLVPQDVVEQIDDYIDECSKGFQGEESTISYTADFGDGIEMDIKCCGCDDDSSWLEAVLFENGSEICCTEPNYEGFCGTWRIEYDGIAYEAEVEAELPQIQCPPEYIMVKIRRQGTNMTVPFRLLMEGDRTIDPRYPQITCTCDAHLSEDASMETWVVFDTDEEGFFPEDFGAVVPPKNN